MLPPRAIRFLKLFIDASYLSCAFVLAYLLRFDGEIPYQHLKQMILALPYVLATQIFFLVVFRSAKSSWRYFGLLDTRRLLLALAPSTTVLLFLRIFFGQVQSNYHPYLKVPFGIILIHYGLSFLGLSILRGLRRTLHEKSSTKNHPTSRQNNNARILLLGAGNAGISVAKELENRPDLGLLPIGFLDDDPSKLNLSIHGLNVLGPSNALEETVSKYEIEQILLTVTAPSADFLRQVLRQCEEVNVPLKIVPGISEVVGEFSQKLQIRQVSIEDLLHRQAVQLDMQSIGSYVQGRTVMVTGAGGSIGSELCRQLMRFAPSEILLFERNENGLFAINRELNGQPQTETTIVPLIGDMTDANRIRSVLTHHRPFVIFHAAAHKHVEMMENNPVEAIKNNIGGTMLLADIAGELKTPNFVMISTDKAVNPTSIMGASKRAAEMYIKSIHPLYPDTKYAAVRFGNVLGSNGSVVPIFQTQIESGGPITVTHPEMQRYFMTIPEATQLVLQAAVLCEDGEIFILDMGEPVKIVDLAQDLVRLSGLRPGRDIKIEFTGIKPGEKLFEELNMSSDNLLKTRHPSIFVVSNESTIEDAQLGQKIKRMCDQLTESSPEKVYAYLKEIIPNYTLRDDISRQLEKNEKVIPLHKIAKD